MKNIQELDSHSDEVLQTAPSINFLVQMSPVDDVLTLVVHIPDLH